MNWIQAFIDVATEPTFSSVTVPGIVGSLIASVIFALMSLIFGAPFTAWLIKREQDKRLLPLRTRIEAAFCTLISDTLMGLENCSAYMKIYEEHNAEEKLDDVETLMNSASNIHVFAENQIIRLDKFLSMFNNLNDGLEPTERFETYDLIQGWSALNREELQNISSAAFALIRICKEVSFPLDRSAYFQVRPLRKFPEMIPDDSFMSNLNRYVKGKSNIKQIIPASPEMMRVNVSNYLSFLGAQVADFTLRKDLTGGGFLSDVTDLASLQEHNILLYGSKWPKHPT